MGLVQMGVIITQARGEKTQEVLADEIRVSQAWISKVETGGIDNPATDRIKRLASALSLSYRHLIAVMHDIGPDDLKGITATLPEERLVRERIDLPPDITPEEQAAIAEKARRYVESLLPVFVQEAREARVGDPTTVVVLPTDVQRKAASQQRNRG